MQKNTDKQNIPGFDDFEVFPWNTNFETGHNKIDAQHKNLVALLNKLARTLTIDDTETVNSAFEELADYADYHFTDEENYWHKYMADDNWFISHKKSHSDFLPKVMEMKSKTPARPLTEVVEDVVKFLIRWLAFHILDNDKRISLAVTQIISGKNVEESKIIADTEMDSSMRLLIETIMNMYEGLSASAINLLRERTRRFKAEEALIEMNKQLEILSITDQLTGLYNRRHFLLIFNQELKRARREQKALTYIQLDIDFFKIYNDTYGHLKGDEALEKVSRAFKKICRRPDDFIFRIGGEEFGFIAANLSADKAFEFGEKIRKTVEELKIPNVNSTASKHLTVSLGIINKKPSGGDNMTSFIKIADENLYKSKNSGRNMVCISSIAS